MDAKERLRLYLEQRRDAGESELVLDSMDVDDVMRLLGAASARAASPARAATDSPAAMAGGRDVERDVREPRVARESSPEPAEGARRGAASDDAQGDWRAALRALDADKEGSVAKDRSAGRSQPSRAEPPREEPPRSDTERAPAPSAPPARAASATAGEDAPSRAPEEPAREGRAGGGGDSGARDASHATMPLEHVPAGIVVGSPAHELFGGPSSPYATLEDIAAATRACTLCSLHATAKNAVPGHGNPHADFVCVGEAPGATEDEQGLPFVGAAGQLLTKILGAIQLTREDVFICNVLKHRPPGNRNPTPDEVTACSPYLVRQIELLAPKVIVALGTFAAQTLLQTKEPIGRLRGRIHRYYGVPLIVTYHPAALLRNPSWKRPTWEDVQLARRLFDRARGS